MKYLRALDHEAKPTMALVLTAKEWGSIHQPIINAEKEERDKEQCLVVTKDRKLKCKAMIAKWPNTLATTQLEREQLILGKSERERQERINEYYEMIEVKKLEREEKIKKAKKLINEKKESTRIINNALILSNVLYERSKQVELEKIKREKSIERALEETNKMRRLAEAYAKEEHEKMIKHAEAMQVYKDMLDAQLCDVLGKRETERKQNEQEEMDKINGEREIALSKEKERQELKEKKDKLKQEQRLWAEIHSQYKEQKKAKEEELDKMISIYQTVQEKMRKQREETEKKIKEEVMARRNMRAEENRNKQIFIEQKEEELFQKVLRERDENLAKELEKKELKKEQLRQELISFMKEAETISKDNAKQRLEMERFEVLRRIAIAEEDRKWKATQNEEKRDMQRKLREALRNQMNEQEKSKIESKLDEVAAFERQRANECNELLQYCEEIKKEVEGSGRPLYPVLAAIEEVKRSAGITDNKKKVKFLQSRVPISSVEAYEK